MLGLLIFGITHLVLSSIIIIEVKGTPWVKLVQTVLLLFEFLAIISAGLLFGTFTAPLTSSNKSPHIVQEKELPHVDVFVPIKNEPLIFISKTLESLTHQNYPEEKLHIYVGNDSENLSYVGELEKLCNDLGVFLIHQENHAYKAGMLNILLEESDSPIIITFDHDHVPAPTAVKDLVSTLISLPPKYAFVQAKARFGNIKNQLHAWAALLYAQYFEIIDVAKDKKGTLIYNGTTAAFRRNAIAVVGGFPTDTFTEDAGLSTLFMIYGYQGYFLNKVLSEGTVPESYSKQVRQLWRWSHGGTSILRKRGKDLLSTPHLTLGQKIDALSAYLLFIVLVGAYIYVMIVFILIFYGIPLYRPNYHFPSSILAPTLISLVYAMMAIYAMILARRNEGINFSFANFIVPLIISVATNPFLFGAVFLALMNKRGPDDPKAQWNRKINVRMSTLAYFAIGLLLIYSGYYYVMLGFNDAYLAVLIGLTLIPGIFLHLLYD